MFPLRVQESKISMPEREKNCSASHVRSQYSRTLRCLFTLEKLEKWYFFCWMLDSFLDRLSVYLLHPALLALWQKIIIKVSSIDIVHMEKSFLPENSPITVFPLRLDLLFVLFVNDDDPLFWEESWMLLPSHPTSRPVWSRWDGNVASLIKFLLKV